MRDNKSYNKYLPFMTIQNIREELLNLDSLRQQLTQKLISLTQRLQESRTNLTDPLVIDGFPRNDIDLYQVRTLRQNYRITQNDLYEIDKKIETLLPQALSATVESTQNLSHQQSNYVENATYELPKEWHIIVNAVDPDSPAYIDGLRRGDIIFKINGLGITKLNSGWIFNGENFRSETEILERISILIIEHNPLNLNLVRGFDETQIVLIPRKWSGHGLLGIHMKLQEQK
eukprot:NODE_101_length_19951_cov_0.932501.p10 type:complete len:231 gc:universal NODE_101_length_19951_cov_0.932501:14928-15620(+)